MKKIVVNCLMVVLVIAITAVVAQARGPHGFSTPDADTPIDGGASLLLAGGIAYGAKVMRARKKAKETSK